MSAWRDKLLTISGKPWAWLLALAFLLTPSAHLVAGINSGAAFLRIGTGARPAAMGGAYTAMADDVDALYYNPGGLGNLNRRELGFTHAEYLLDTKFDFAGFAQPTRLGTLGLGVTRMTSGNFDGRGGNREQTGNFEAADEAYALSYSRGLGHLGFGQAKAGASFKYLRSSIAGFTAQTVAVDLGAQQRVGQTPLSLGVAVLNIGKGMSFIEQSDPLPLTISLGAAYNVKSLFNVALDVRHEPNDSRTDVGIGTEYALLRGFALRAGYTSQAAGDGSQSAGPLGGLGGGFGLKMKSYRADYTFTPFGELGNVQRISLGARW